MLKGWDFTENELCQKYFDNNLQKIFGTNIPEDGTVQMFLIAILMVGLYSLKFKWKKLIKRIPSLLVFHLYISLLEF